MITTEINDLLAPVDYRMSVILPSESHGSWASPALEAGGQLTDPLRPDPGEEDDGASTFDAVKSVPSTTGWNWLNFPDS